MCNLSNNELLEYISDSLSADNTTEYRKYERYFNTISSLLQNGDEFQCTRVILSGSMAKGTALNYKFDCDILAYADLGRDFLSIVTQKTKFINTMESILSPQLTNMSNVKTTANSFQFSIGNFDFDILPVANMLKDGERENVHSIQHRRIVRLCHRQENYKLASFKLKASLSEMGDIFVKSRSNFVHHLIIICKHWCRIYLKDVNFGGRSSAMELIAVRVGLDLEEQKDYMLFKGFMRFLKICSQIRKCQIIFQLSRTNKMFKELDFINTRPFIRDPINPYNNRLQGAIIGPRGGDNLGRIEEIAKNSLEKLSLIKYIRKCYSEFNDFLKLSEFMNNYESYEEYLAANSNSRNTQIPNGRDSNEKRITKSITKRRDENDDTVDNSLRLAFESQLTIKSESDKHQDDKGLHTKSKLKSKISNLEKINKIYAQYFDDTKQEFTRFYKLLIRKLIRDAEKIVDIFVSKRNNLNSEDKIELASYLDSFHNNLKEIMEMIAFMDASWNAIARTPRVMNLALSYKVSFRELFQTVQNIVSKLNEIVRKLARKFKLIVYQFVQLNKELLFLPVNKKSTKLMICLRDLAKLSMPNLNLNTSWEVKYSRNSGTITEVSSIITDCLKVWNSVKNVALEMQEALSMKSTLM